MCFADVLSESGCALLMYCLSSAPLSANDCGSFETDPSGAKAKQKKHCVSIATYVLSQPSTTVCRRLQPLLDTKV